MNLKQNNFTFFFSGKRSGVQWRSNQSHDLVNLCGDQTERGNKQRQKIKRNQDEKITNEKNYQNVAFTSGMQEPKLNKRTSRNRSRPRRTQVCLTLDPQRSNKFLKPFQREDTACMWRTAILNKRFERRRIRIVLNYLKPCIGSQMCLSIYTITTKYYAIVSVI